MDTTFGAVKAFDRISSKSKTTSFSSSNVQPQAGTYTKQTLLELQKNTKTIGSSSIRKPPPPPEKVEKHESVVVLKAKREKARKSSGSAFPDYIAIDGGSNHGEAEGLSDEEPEFVDRVRVIGDNRDRDRDEVRRGVFEDFTASSSSVVRSDNGGDGVGEDEDDEEERKWEEEQVRKGLGMRREEVNANVNVVQSVGVRSRDVYTSVVGAGSVGLSVGGLSIGGSVGWAPGSGPGSGSSLDTLTIAQQAELSKKALHDSVRRLKETHGRTLTTLTKTDENLSDSLTKVTALENALTAAGEKFIFMQKLRDYVTVICDFLQHKAPFIEELEYQMQKLHKERAEAIMERRSADNTDELMELEASVNAAMAVFNKGGLTSSMVEAATNAAQAASIASKESRNLPVKLDEFGRDVNQQNRMDMKRRAESRQRRKSRSESKRMSLMEIDCSIEGESSTDESDSESTAYESNRDQLLQIAGQIFSDADEDFSQLSSVKEKFGMWKKDYASSYRDAYMSLSIPAIFSPYVRLELLKWDPLHQDSDFVEMQWHELLFSYGMPEDGSEMNPDDVDANIIPDLVEKVAVPILQHEIANCWDILSTKETKYAVAASTLVLGYPLSSKAINELLGVLRDRLSDAVANLMVPTWNTLVLKAVPNAARFAAYKFGMSVRLMRNICLWNTFLPTSVFEKIALDELLSGKIIPHLRSIQSDIHDAITRTERVVASLSGVWSGPSVTSERSPRLQPLVDYLLVLGKTLEKRKTYSETNGLARRLKKMLVELNEYDFARYINKTFNLKEAL
ncbi:GC-rich sequence DNA-binding factor [Artemisia annua]|uniref:GC-rich sequence DNA-binding factor n=1 Tax=Artemisia annua TaxID=35608 RepID=A0A2U1NG51_ARTAN|nr:GC-rich sequence DNA-binding factor [Artemisia annua]